MAKKDASAFDGLGQSVDRSGSNQNKSRQPQGDRIAKAVAGSANRNKVMEAILGLYEAEQAITRSRVAEVAGVSCHVADDHLDRLVLEGKLRRVVSGVYEPVLQFPQSRAITHTLLPDGMSKTEIGDDMLTLTPKERQALGKLLLSDALAHKTIQATYDFNVMVSEMVTCMLLLRRNTKFIDEIGLQLGIKVDPATAGLDDRLQVLAEKLMSGAYSYGG